MVKVMSVNFKEGALMRGIYFCSIISVLVSLQNVMAQEPPRKTAPLTKEPGWVTYDDAGLKVLIRYLKEKEEIVLRMSLDTLARMGTKANPAASVIVEMLKHPDWQIKMEATRTLFDIDSETEAAFRVLTAALKDRDAKVRTSAAAMIADIVNPPQEWPSCWGPGPRPQTPRPAVGKKAVPLLMEVLKDESAAVRCSAATSLGQIGSDARAAIPVLLNALEDELAVRKAAADAAKAIVMDAGAKAGVK